MSDWVPTTCMRCAVGCGHLHRGADIGNGIDVARGDAAHPVNQGLACQRGIRESQDPDGEWLNRPLVRRGGDLVPTTWDVALSEVLDGFRAVPDESVAILGSGQQTNEAAYALGKLARGGFGTRYYDANTTLCMASAVTAYYEAFGSDAPPCSYDDIPEADAHVVWGANPGVAHPVMYRWIRQAVEQGGQDGNGAELLVVDPVETGTAQDADTHVAPNPGTDLALARAVLAHLVDTDRIDADFVAEHTQGFAELRKALPHPEAAAAVAGVGMDAVETLAAAFDRRALCYWGMGVNQHVQGTDIARAIIDLTLATGNVRPGGGPFSLTGQANSMGTRVCACKGSWPGHREFTDPDERRLVADEWGVPIERLPPDPGPGPVGLFEAIGEEMGEASDQRAADTVGVEAVLTVATNPVVGMPDAGPVRERLEDTFLVAQDAFHTETTNLADVVLPAATWGESAGTAMNMERTISRVRAATGTPSGVWSDLRIIATVGARLFPDLFEDPDPDPARLFDEFAGLTAGTVADCSGIDYDRLERETAVRWPAPDEETSVAYRYFEGETDPNFDGEQDPDCEGKTDPKGESTSDAEDGDWSFPTPSGRAAFSTATGVDRAEPPDEAYPLTLTTAREADGYNTGVRSRDVDDPAPLLARVNPETLATGGLADGERAALSSRRATVTVTVAADEAVPVDLVWLPIHHPLTNHLTIDALDPRSKEPNFKQCAVRLTPSADSTPTPADD